MDDVRRSGAGGMPTPVGAALAAAPVTALEALKRDYITAYAEAHRRLRLGPAADERRTRLYADPRLAALNALAALDLVHRSELEAWKDAIAGLGSCREFHEGALAATPTCPHCHLRPGQASGEARAEALLAQLDGRLDEILRRWRGALRANLGSETAQHSLAAMTPAERRPIERFLAQADDAAEIPEGFVAAAGQALRGIEALALQADRLLDALAAGGLPCTVDEFGRRFTEYLRAVLRGHDPRNTRVTLDR